MKELFKKYLKRECSPQEVHQIITYLKNNHDLSGVPTFDEISEILDTYPDLDEDVANRIYKRILKKEHKKDVSTKKLYLFWKYAVAAVFTGLIATGYFFKDAIFAIPSENKALVADNEIKPGNNKAILTLADGTEISLEKGNTYQNKGIDSDGQKIVYNKKSTKCTKTEYNYLTIPRGGEFFIKLSDGTQVWLNSESKLKYPTNFEKGETRMVELVYGEAYFDVSPSTSHYGTKFVVVNKAQEIEVIGTEFNVKAYKGENNVSTTLVEGKVKVTSDEVSKLLKPSQQINLNVADNQFSEIIEVNVYNEISWKKGVFSFRKKTLYEITTVLSRWYDVDFVFDNETLKNKGFTGVLGKDQNLTEILENIKQLKAINNYEIKNKRVLMK